MLLRGLLEVTAMDILLEATKRGPMLYAMD